MKKMNWLYACSLAMTLGALCSCSNDDNMSPETGEIVQSPDAKVEYYIVGTVTNADGKMVGANVTVNNTPCVTDNDGHFLVATAQTGAYDIKIAPEGYVPQQTTAVIADGASNRSFVLVNLAMTRINAAEKVEASAGGEVQSRAAQSLNPNDVVESAPIATVKLNIPAGALEAGTTGVDTDGNANISVTAFVPTTATTTAAITKTSLPLVAAHFEPSGLTFKDPATLLIQNPIAKIEFTDGLTLTCLNTETGQWEAVASEVERQDANYRVNINHFSAYAVENKVTTTVSGVTVDQQEVLGEKRLNNSESYNAMKDVELTYNEKSGWECTDETIAEALKPLNLGTDTDTRDAMIAFIKTRLYLLMGSASGITETTRVYNTVNVSGYTTAVYACYPKVCTTTMNMKVAYNGSSPVEISVPVKRYVGTDHYYRTYQNTHSGGQGGNI